MAGSIPHGCHARRSVEGQTQSSEFNGPGCGSPGATTREQGRLLTALAEVVSAKTGAAPTQISARLSGAGGVQFELSEEDHVDRDRQVDRHGHSRYGEADEDRDDVSAEDGQEFSRFIRPLFALLRG